MEIFNTHQIRPAEIQGLYLCSFDWAKLIQVLPKEKTLSRYVVDASKDHPPIYNTHQSQGLHANIFIATQPLLDHLNEVQGRKGEHLSRNEKLILNPCFAFPFAQYIDQYSMNVCMNVMNTLPELQICLGLLSHISICLKAKTLMKL